MCLERVVSTSVRLWCHNYTRSSPLEAVAVKTWAQLRQKHSGKIGLFQWRALNTQIYSGATTNRKTQPQKAESITLTSAGKGSYVLPLKISAEWMDAVHSSRMRYYQSCYISSKKLALLVALAMHDSDCNLTHYFCVYCDSHRVIHELF